LEPDPEALADALARCPGSDGVAVRTLGNGIVEVVGDAPDDDVVEVILAALADVPGVDAVVNRVWTPSSASPGLPEKKGVAP
jgi:hypothetical protein